MSGRRYISKGLIAALIFSVVIAFLISLIPSFNISDYQKEIPVFNDQKNAYLTNFNIVDFVASFSTEMQIKKVTWRQETLAIDFYIDENNNLDTNVIYEDIFNFIKKGFNQTSNVDKILIRVLIDDKEELFVAVSANRDDIINNPTMKLDSSMLHKDFLNKYFGLNFGNSLKRE